MSHKKSSTPPHFVRAYHVRCSGTGRIPPYAVVPPPRSTGSYWPLTGRGREYFWRVAPTAASTRVDSGDRAAPVARSRGSERELPRTPLTLGRPGGRLRAGAEPVAVVATMDGSGAAAGGGWRW